MRTYQVGKTLVVGRGPIGRRLAPRGLIGRVDPGRLLIGRCCGGGGTGSEWNLLTRQRRRTLEAGEGRSGREKVEGRIAALAVAAGGGGGGSLRGLDLARLAVVARDLGPRRLLREEVGVDHGGCFDWAYCFLLLVCTVIGSARGHREKRLALRPSVPGLQQRVPSGRLLTTVLSQAIYLSKR